MPKAVRISAIDCSYPAHSSGEIVRSGSGSSGARSSTMLKRNLLSRWSQQAEPGGERDESCSCGDRPTGVPAEPCEERSVDEQVALGVEIAAERGDAIGEPCELAVRVVEHGLRLHEQRRDHQMPACELDCAE